MMYQVNYKIFSTDVNEHSRIFSASKQKEAEEQFKEYCKGMRLHCDIISIEKL